MGSKKFLILYIYAKSKDSKISDLLYQKCKKVFCASSLNEARNKYKQYSPCMILLEDEFNSYEAVEFLRSIRQTDIKTAIMVLTSNKHNRYLSELVELYITRYIIKPYTKEVLEEAIMKCSQTIEHRIYSHVDLGRGILFNYQTQSIIKDKEVISLNKKETILINLFLQNPNRVISYEELEYHIWEFGVTNAALKSLIRDFRKKTYGAILKNFSKEGYKLNIEAK